MSASGGNRLPSLAAEVAQAHDACRRSTRGLIRHAVAAGRALIEAKRLVPHGRWVPWLRANAPSIAVRTAQRCMAAAERAGKNDTGTLFRLRDLARPTRERVGFLDAHRALILTPSTHPGFTHVTVVDRDTREASGFLRPMRDDAIEGAIRTFHHSSLPATWATWRSARHPTNPRLVGAERVARPDQAGLIEEVIAAADRKLDLMGYTGPREIFPEEARP